jgi:hypothetical protein
MWLHRSRRGILHEVVYWSCVGASAVYGPQDGGDGNSSDTGIYPWTGEFSVRMKSGGDGRANVGRELKYVEVGEWTQEGG